MSDSCFDQSAGLRALRSGELAKLAGVTVRTLRHYRTIGLLPDPPRDENGYCSYGIEDLVRVLRIKRLASLGFSLEDIGGMLDDMDAATSSVQKASTTDAAQAEKAGASESAANGGSEGGQAAEGAGAPPAPSAADKGPEGNIPQPERVFERLDALDQELKDQIAHLEEQRRTIASLRPDKAPASGRRVENERGGAVDKYMFPAGEDDAGVGQGVYRGPAGRRGADARARKLLMAQKLQKRRRLLVREAKRDAFNAVCAHHVLPSACNSSRKAPLQERETGNFSPEVRYSVIAGISRRSIQARLTM